MSKKKVLLLLVGPSGGGKSRVADMLQQRGLKKLISYTTRPSRGPLDDHIFISEEEFCILPDLAAYTEFNGHRYGATKRQVRESDVYIVDVPGVESLVRNKPAEVHLLAAYITATAGERRRRMVSRGNTVEEANERLVHDRTVFDGAQERLAELLGPYNVVYCSNEHPDDLEEITNFLLECFHNLQE